MVCSGVVIRIVLVVLVVVGGVLNVMRYAQSVIGISCGVRKRVQTVVVGSYLKDGGSQEDIGSVYVYVRYVGSLAPGPGQWQLQEELVASDGRANDRFGYAVAMDEDMVVVGAPGDDTNTGSAYVFMRVFLGGRVQSKISGQN